MILYLDTSALVKAYIAEEFSHDVMSHISNADIISTHRIAFIEAHAAFARLNRENKLTDLELNTTKQVFVNDSRRYGSTAVLDELNNPMLWRVSDEVFLTGQTINDSFLSHDGFTRA